MFDYMGIIVFVVCVKFVGFYFNCVMVHDMGFRKLRGV